MSWPWPPLCSSTSQTGATPSAWDYGIRWRTLRTVHPVDPIVSVDFISQQVIRVVNGTAENDNIANLIAVATEEAEEMTQRALMPSTWEMTLSGFPSGDIVLERPPLIEVLSFGYTDGDGDPQTLAVSPLDFQVIPSGKYQKARLRVLSGASWPSTISTEEAVTITYRAGYEDTTDPQCQLIARGIAIMVGEMYKQRSLTVVGTSIVPSPLDLMRFFKKVY